MCIKNGKTILICLVVTALSFFTLTRLDGFSRKTAYGLSLIFLHDDKLRDTLFFPRIPKTGSTTLRKLMEKVAKKNNVKYVNNANHYNIEPVEEFVKNFTAHPMPMLYVQHAYYVDFTQYGFRSNPHYILLVRDPVEQYVSWYHYSREDRVLRKQSIKTNAERWINRPINQHILNYVDAETYLSKREYRGTIQKHLCGTHLDCMESGPLMLERAKYNLQHSFAVVGVLERMEDSLRLLEHLFPEQLSGLLHEYKRLPDKKVNSSFRKYNLTSEARRKLEKIFSADYELYSLAKEKLSLQVDSMLKSAK